MSFKTKMQGFAEKVKAFTDKINQGVDNGIKVYNDKVDSMHKPTVQVETSKNMVLIIGAVLVAVFLMFGRKK